MRNPTFQITEICLDFSDSEEPVSDQFQQQLTDDLIGSFWEAEDGDDLIEEITAGTGWCVRSIDYRQVLA